MAQPISNELWNDYRTRLLRFVRSRVYDDASAEDIVHDALAKAWAQRNSLKSDESVVPWLFQITMNTIRDAARKSTTSPLAPAGKADIELEEEVVAPTAESDKKDFTKCMLTMIDGLDANNRATFVRSEIDGIPMYTIATEMGLSVSAVKSRIQRTRAKLKDAMISCCGLEVNSRGQITNADDVECTCC